MSDMETTRQRRIGLHWALGLAMLISAWQTGAADAEVQRQLQLREQQQMELRLKMQQQLDRSIRPPQTPSADLQMRQLDRDQQQRLQQFHDQQLRGTIAPATPATAEQMRRDLERQRALKSGPASPGPFASPAQPPTLDTGNAP